MTHITEERVIGNHAAMGKSPPAAPDTPFLTLENIFRAGARRAARRREILAAQSTWDSHGGGGPEGGGYDEYLLDAEFLDDSNVQ
jgi:hypothetical protein